MKPRPQRITIRATRGLRGRLKVPGDKSITHRALILGALAEGRTEVIGFLKGEDCLRTAHALTSMGIEVKGLEGNGLSIEGRGLLGLREPEEIIDCGNSGTTMRLLAGVLAGQPFLAVLTGDRSLRTRPMGRVVEPLRRMGATILGREGGDLPPLAIQGGPLRGIVHKSPVASAQVKSALLFAGLFAEGETRVVEPLPSRDHTERMLQAFGVPIAKDGTTVSLTAPRALLPQRILVPGDFSSAAFFLVAALLVSDSELIIQDVGVNPTRTGLLDALRSMGAEVGLENLREVSGEPVADIWARSSRLRGVELSGDLIPRLIDEIPILAVALSLADGTSIIRDAAELRVKEVDRIAVLASELRKLGAKVEELQDGMIIEGGRLCGASCSSFGDHRIAMALTIAGLVAEGETTIDDPSCVDVSFPGFFQVLAQVAPDAFTGEVDSREGEDEKPKANPAMSKRLIIAIDGPVAAGKSTVAKLLAKRLGYRYIDTGAMYRALAWKALSLGLDLKDEQALAPLAERTTIECTGEADATRILVDGQDVTAAIRRPEIDEASSLVSSHGEVRKRLVALQRRMAGDGGVVMDGRDIGTVVFPDADLKFYLEASLDVRARRRFLELKAMGRAARLEEVLREVRRRDLRDTGREVSPLRRAEDAIVIDSSRLGVEEVVQAMWEAVQGRLAPPKG